MGSTCAGSIEQVVASQLTRLPLRGQPADALALARKQQREQWQLPRANDAGRVQRIPALLLLRHFAFDYQPPAKPQLGRAAIWAAFLTGRFWPLPRVAGKAGPAWSGIRRGCTATVCSSRLELTLHGSLALSLAADVVVLPLHTRH